MLFGSQHFSLTLGEWISQGLMALFFFLTGLEIKREILAGKLRRFDEVSLIICGALGGIIVPALFYTAFNYGEAGHHGWAIPTATDTAFAVGIMALMSSRVSVSMTIFLTALSIFDDIGAVFIISFFYAQHIDINALGLAFLILLILFAVNRVGIRNGWVYAVLGLILWFLIYKSGVHPTCAGLLLAAMIPARTSISQLGFIRNIQDLLNRLELKQTSHRKMLESSGQHSIVSDIGKNVQEASTPLQRWENSMIVPIAVIVLPLFALFNAGIPFSGDLIMKGLNSPIALGTIAGLVAGKPLGILLFIFAGMKLRIGTLPKGVNMNEIMGISLLAGIGFTMSIFFATLSFGDNQGFIEEAKLGIVLSSFLSAFLGIIWIYWNPFILIQKSF